MSEIVYGNLLQWYCIVQMLFEVFTCSPVCSASAVIEEEPYISLC